MDTLAADWRGLPEYAAVIRLRERRGKPLTLNAVHALAMQISKTLLAVRRELQVEVPALLVRAAFEYLHPARDFIRKRALSLEELNRLRMKSAVWQKWAKSSGTYEASPAHLEDQLHFIKYVGLDAAFDLVELIELSVPAGGPRKCGEAFTAEQNVDLIRRIADGASLRGLANQLGVKNFTVIRDRRDALWQAVADELAELMPRKKAPKRDYGPNPRRGAKFWARQPIVPHTGNAGGTSTGGESLKHERNSSRVHGMVTENEEMLQGLTGKPLTQSLEEQEYFGR